MKYFAYGSNLLPSRLLARCTDAAVVGTAWLAGYALRWNKQGKDGTGKCNIVPLPGSRVPGAVYEIPAEQMAELDLIEGGYERVLVKLESGLDAWTYVALPDYVDETVVPTAAYVAFVRDGRAWHGLPALTQGA